MAMKSSSVSGILSFLSDSDNSLKIRSLEILYQVVDVHWAEICNSLPLIEELSEIPEFLGAELAAAVASKCFFHLQEYNDSLRLALCSGNYLNISLKDEYIETILSKCIDEYKLLRTERCSDPSVIIDPKMEIIVEQMFQRCYKDLCFEQSIGIALDTRRIDKVEEVISVAINSGNDGILGYTFDLCQNARNVTPRDFRLSVIATLVKFYSALSEPDYANVCFGLQYLNLPSDAAKTLDLLLHGSEEDALLAYQIAFDFQETENQGFVLKVLANLPKATESGDSVYLSRLEKISKILHGGLDVALTLNFLFKQSHADINILKDIKTSIEGRSNVLHNATVVTHAYMNAGTTRDSFLRENLDWLGKAKSWAKFTAVGSIGVVHKGHVRESMNLLQPYLPSGGESSSPYSESGALYALGLIHANKGGSGDSATITYLSEALRNCGNNEIVQHGACLGIGLSAMATGNEELFESLRAILFTDSAIAGEGAAFAIGLLLLGQCDSTLAQSVLPDLLNYLHDTSHEKIIRALSLSIAMMVYEKEESADVIIDQLLRDRDPIVRYGAMYAIGMAYCGTADNASVRKLLHVAVSDVSDDVRRAAVTCIGFLMLRSPESVPKLVSLLAESFNPHVRYGACLAIGISCAGMAFKDAIDLLTPMLDDVVDFVRQGALISLALVLQQTSELRSPSVKKFRDLLSSILNDKHQPVLAKSGAILASGIIDAGGGNVVVSMQSRAGFMKMGGVVGIMMFLQHWYWYPLLPFLSLSFSPTMLMGLNGNFDMPIGFQVTCSAPYSMFSYSKTEEKKEDGKRAVATAVLSTTLRTKQRQARKDAHKLGVVRQPSMESETHIPLERVISGVPLERVTSHLSTVSFLSVEMEKPTVVKSGKLKESSSFIMSNPSRLLPAQGKYVTLQVDQRYVPVCRLLHPAGIVMLRDATPSEPENVIKFENLALGDEIADKPESFEWDPLVV